MANSRRVAIAAVTAALSAGALAGPAPASESRGYADYLGSDSAPLAKLSDAGPSGVLTVSPTSNAQPVKVTPNQAAKMAATTSIAPLPAAAPKPYRLKNATTNGRSEAAAPVQVVCNYAPFLSGTPAPPVSGSSFGVAKSINGAPRSTAAKNPGLFQGGQAAAVQSGTGGTTTRTGTTETRLPISIGSGWPAGSALKFWYNPLFRGRGTTQSAISPIYQYSTASVQHRLEDSVGFNNETSYRTLWNFSLSNNSGVGKTTPIYQFGGYPSGTVQERSIPITGIGTYQFRVRTVTTATADSDIGAAASAIMDFGSGVLDTPAGLAPYNFYTMPNASTSTQQPYRHLTAVYVLPAGWGTSC